MKGLKRDPHNQYIFHLFQNAKMLRKMEFITEMMMASAAYFYCGRIGTERNCVKEEYSGGEGKECDLGVYHSIFLYMLGRIYLYLCLIPLRLSAPPMIK